MSVSDLRDDWPASALHAADAAFAALTTGPKPLCLDCAALTAAEAAAAGTAAAGSAGETGDGTGVTADVGADLDPLPGELPLPVLRDWLMAHRRAYTARDAVWRELIRRARQGRPEWVIAAAGMAMPALVAMAGTLAAGYRGDPEDIDAEVLTGFLEGLRVSVDPARDAPHASLCFVAWRAGRDLRLAQQEYVLLDEIEYAAAEPRLPRMPYGHPDLLVYRARALGVIDDDDAEPYIAIRLGRRTPELVAEALRIDQDVLRMRLNRADARLAEALATGVLAGTCSRDTLKRLAQRQDLRAKTRAGIAAARRTAARRPSLMPVAAAA